MGILNKYERIQPRIVRMVWALVTEEPAIPTALLASRIRRGTSTVHTALHLLRDAGYIDFPDRGKGARTVLIPFVLIKKAS